MILSEITVLLNKFHGSNGIWRRVDGFNFTVFGFSDLSLRSRW